MSMKWLTMIQFSQTFGIYVLLTLLLPALVFGNKVKQYKLSERFLLYFISGNFYVMHIVFILQLLHISNRFTLILATILPSVAVWSRFHQVSMKEETLRKIQQARRLLEGKMGIKTALVHMRKDMGQGLGKIGKTIWNLGKGRWLDFLLVGAFVVYLTYTYGTNMLNYYGYTASDMPVHNYWINYLGQNEIFVAGVYPFGFHCILYYIHEVFGLDTYVLLRVFGLVQNLFIHGMILAFLKGCCKNRFTPYIGLAVYLVGNYFNSNTYYRFLSSLPQEFGMVFIFPAIYFAIAFFRREKERENIYLAGFAMSFAMTLAVHFYDTIIAGVFCIGIVLAFASRVFRKGYFGRILLTCVISVAIAVLPMGIAYATGTPLEGSLRWGMAVVSGALEEDEDAEPESNSEIEEGKSPVEDLETATGESQLPEGTEGEQVVQAPGFWTKLTTWVEETYDTIVEGLSEYVIPIEGAYYASVVLWSILGLFLVGMGQWLRKDRHYASILLSTAIFLGFMCMLQSASSLGLPSLMDGGRCSVYFAYAIPLLVGLLMDGILMLGLGFLKSKHWRNGVSFLLLVVMLWAMEVNGVVKEPLERQALETNGAITALTNIIWEEEDFTWTICSSNDETRMGEDHGYHYEITDFLNAMEYAGPHVSLTLPTPSVYIFIEKIPLDYEVSYEGSGQFISEEGASRELPYNTDLSNYQGENRWIYMSRLYYWAQEFQKMYPNEMKVYLETEDFICYKITQNPYALFNFSIDYGYNRVL